MWHVEYTADTDLPPGAVWAALRKLQTGTVALATGDRRQLNGLFAVGSTISVHPVGLDPLESTITELDDQQVLAEQTDFRGLLLLLRHTLSPAADGGTRITRRLEISGPTADQQGPIAGPRISEDYPEALEEIIATARSRS